MVDKVGNVKVGNKMLYNKETGHVYDANGNRVKRGRSPHGQTENSKYKKAVGEGIDPDRTYVGKSAGLMPKVSKPLEHLPKLRLRKRLNSGMILIGEKPI